MASPASPGAGGGAPPAAAPARKLTAIDKVGGIHCHICSLTLGSKKEFDNHFRTHITGTDVITYTCVACNIPFTNYPSFRGHCYTHHVIKDRFQCKHCNKTFSKMSPLQEHIDAIHSFKFKCNKPSCDKQFPSKKELHLHQVIHKSEANKPPYPCTSCKVPIDTIDMCEHHIDEHCVFTYQCPICNEDIKKDNANKHLSQHFTGEVLTTLNVSNILVNETPEDSSINIVGGILCRYCDTLFKNRVEIDLHFAEEHPEESIVYSCNICDKYYEKYNQFGQHCYYHYSKSRFACESCDMRFPRLSLLVLHAEVHSEGAAGFPCAYCARVLPSTRRLRDHTRAAHEGAALACPEPHCPQVFGTPKELILHCKYHKSSPERWCRQCGLQFPSLAAAERHLDVHKKKQFTCPVCTRPYGEKYLLLKHVPQHFEVVFHMCKICGKVFNAKNRLIEHVKIHSSVKTFECHLCGKGFFKPYQLSQHVNIHTGARPYKCVACPKAFASQPNLKKHMHRMHNLNHKISFKSGMQPLSNSQDEPKDANSGSEDSTSQELKNTYDFCYDESTIDSVTINSLVVEQEAQRVQAEADSLEALAADYSIAELTPILPVDTDQLVSELLGSELSCGDLGGWLECPQYGPDFADEPLLPHVAPQLVNSRAPLAPLGALGALGQLGQLGQLGPPAASWEPVITKVCGNYFAELDDGAARLAIINTDIF